VGILMNRLPLGFEVPETIPQKPKVKTPEGVRDNTNNNNTSPLKSDITGSDIIEEKKIVEKKIVKVSRKHVFLFMIYKKQNYRIWKRC
jgi:hypothetical protein